MKFYEISKYTKKQYRLHQNLKQKPITNLDNYISQNKKTNKKLLANNTSSNTPNKLSNNTTTIKIIYTTQIISITKNYKTYYIKTTFQKNTQSKTFSP